MMDELMNKRMSMEYCWNDIDRVKLKYSGEILCQLQFLHHKSHTVWPENWKGPSC
jgi:hypothetical protein